MLRNSVSTAMPGTTQQQWLQQADLGRSAMARLVAAAAQSSRTTRSRMGGSFAPRTGRWAWRSYSDCSTDCFRVTRPPQIDPLRPSLEAL